MPLGKGGRHRAIPFGSKTAVALKRYLRKRKEHPKADRTNRLWLSFKGVLTDDGIMQALQRRGRQPDRGHAYFRVASRGHEA